MNDVMTTNERRRTLVPASHVVEDEGKIVVRIEMPGVAKSDLEIRAEGQELVVSGKRQEPATHGTWLVRERPRGDFHKTFSVDSSIDLDKIEAELEAGILTLTLPMKEAAKPRRIEIRSA